MYSPRANRIPTFFPSNSCKGEFPRLGSAWWMPGGTVMMRYVKYCDRRNLYRRMSAIVCPKCIKRYLQKNPIHVFDLQEDSTRLLTIPSWSVYARQVGMHYQWSFGIDDVDCCNTYHMLVHHSHMTSYYLLTRHNHPYEWQWQWIDSKLVLQD